MTFVTVFQVFRKSRKKVFRKEAEKHHTMVFFLLVFSLATFSPLFVESCVVQEKMFFSNRSPSSQFLIKGQVERKKKRKK